SPLRGLNVYAPCDKKGTSSKMAPGRRRANYSETTQDKRVDFSVLINSDVSWTMVRLPLIEETDERSKTLVSLEDCPGDKISAADLAYFLTEQLSDTAYLRKAPFIANV